MPNKTIRTVLTENRISEFGICDFNVFKNRLQDCRAASRIPTGAKSIIVVLFPYKCKEETPKNICRYATVADYHIVCGNILQTCSESLKKIFRDNSFEWFIDSSPIKEVEAAVRAGLGVRGKNGLLINPTYGSFVFIGEIVTDLKLESTGFSGVCIGCNRCEEMCPTGSIKSGDKTNCLSAISQKKSELTQRQEALIRNSGCIWGCDICQNVCPMNSGSKLTDISEFLESYVYEFKQNDDIENRAFAWRGRKVIDRNLNILNK